MNPLSSRARNTVALAIAPAITQGLLAATIYVNAEDNQGPFNGTSPPTAYRFLNDAINAAANGDVILVAGKTGNGMRYRPHQGDFYDPPEDLREATFLMETGVTISGGWDPLNPSNPADPDTFLSVLSGAIGTSSSSDNIHHVVTANSVGATATLEGFTIQEGYCADLTDTVTPNDCYDDDPEIEQQPTKAGGAGMECVNSNPRIENCVFKANISASGGGLRLLCNSNPLIVGCTFENNEAVAGYLSGGNGGGLYMNGHCSPLVINCTFAENESDHIGGAVAFQAWCTPEFQQCVFDSNTTVDWGGGMRVGFDCSATMRFCTFYGNVCTTTATGYGGGAFAANRDSPPDDGQILIDSSIFWNNTAVAGDQIFIDENDGVTVTVAYCDIPDTAADIGGDGPVTWGDGNFNEDPQFENAGAGDFRLKYISPCLNNGNDADIPTDAADLDGDDYTDDPIPYDVAGESRQVNSQSCIDVGAHECQQQGTCIGDLTGVGGLPDGVVDTDDLLVVLNRWGDAGGAADMASSTAVGCGDGIVNLYDQNVVTENWGNCGSFAPTGLPEWLQECLETSGEDIDALLECIFKHLEG